MMVVGKSFVMPIFMESSMFCYSICRLIPNHTNVGFNFLRAYGSF